MWIRRSFFVIDPATGSVRFARRYSRTGKKDSSVQAAGIRTNLLELEGFDHDMVIPYGNELILLASDLNKLVGYDRTNGQQVWEAPATDVFGTNVEYLIGVYQGFLYAGGEDNVIAYDLQGDGRMVWTIENYLGGQSSCGRAMLTKDGVFVPVGQTILRFDLETGKLLGRVGVRLPGRLPVGNIFSDGEKLWIHSGNRIMALGPAKEKEKEETDEDKNSDKKDNQDADKKDDGDDGNNK